MRTSGTGTRASAAAIAICLTLLGAGETAFSASGTEGGKDRTYSQEPTHRDVKYGTHAKHLLDFWQAESDKPTPVLVSIHGGGFRFGDRKVDAGLRERCLASGISVAAITYRLSDQAIAPAQFEDAARAVQFLRSKSEEWNLDTENFAATGWSAGAGLSMWLALHDDLADPDNEDPVLRQSTRLKCAIPYDGQSSYDPRTIRKLIPECDTYNHVALTQLFDVDLNKLDELPEEKYKLFEEASAITHLTADDPPIMLIYARALDHPVATKGAGIHHARFGKMLKDEMDKLGIRCELEAGDKVKGRRPDRVFAFLKESFAANAGEKKAK